MIYPIRFEMRGRHRHVINRNSFPFYHVAAWFSPAGLNGNADDKDYWAFPKLQVTAPVLHPGTFQVREDMGPGVWRVEINAIRFKWWGRPVGESWVQELTVE